MKRKAIVRVSFEESHHSESQLFMERLIERIFLNQLDLDLNTKGTLLMAKPNNMNEELE